MSHDKNSGGLDRAIGQGSQDALRHQQDALHHKIQKRPLPGVIDATESDAGQPEIPKVGSRDAPGG
jgi:hypothetical protein